ncbi:flagellar assembly protein FliW [Paenibacillus wynnii]|uniref:flagellar assembly protein FliW n=1 Tax=Paenibacillus wynnii TaxID=268407 RepID=UPI00278CA70F|nr:flagellar assembly protein FliW [Paenibacillus wynnii]MDQ0192184.1 flagellar assembly factor FliW [Paenibacillus wynnii]
MLIETTAWGKLEIDEDQIYHFSKGIPGFEDVTEFALIELEKSSFAQLQSTQHESISFLLTDPFNFYHEYEFDLPDTDAEELDIKDAVSVRSIVTIKEQLELSTINLLAPIILNPLNRKGKQVVLHKSSYLTKHPLWAGNSILDKGGE